MDIFTLARKEGFPTQYGEGKSAVTVDVLEAGLILAFVVLGTALFIISLGLSLKRSASALVKVFCSISIGCCLMLGNFGQEWEVGSIDSTRTPYRAGSPYQIDASISIKLGLRSVNVTLKGNGDPNTTLENETINYNERFWWTWDQGRFGFGPYAGLLQRSFREAQRKGLPIPILWVVEYLVIDGEGLRFGRFYRTAGWYTHILMWTAFATWVITNIFLVSVGRNAAYFLALTGGLQILACIVWSVVRNPNALVIPFEHGEIRTSYGTNYWMALICGILCLLLALIIIIMDLRFPDELSAFLELDPISDYDEFVISEEMREFLKEEGGKSPNTMEMSIRPERNQMTSNAVRRTSIMIRRSSHKKAQKKIYRGQLPLPDMAITESYDDDEIPIYENQPVHVVAGSSAIENRTCSTEELCPPPALPKKTKIKYSNLA